VTDNPGERYAIAIEQLGSTNHGIRIGGIYALEALARDSAHDHPVIVEVLTAFIREYAPCACPIGTSAAFTPTYPPEPLAADLQAALTVIGRRDTSRDKRRLNLTNVVLSGAILPKANLAGADLTDTVLCGANLQDANLSKARLFCANLSHAELAGANLRKADMTGVWLNSAKLYEANVAYANLFGAKLAEAELSAADLTGAKLARTDLSNTHLGSACLAGADLSRTNLDGADLKDVSHTGGTRWPPGFEHPHRH
jgi:hypothetical protein